MKLNRKHLQLLSQARMREAKALFSLNLHSGAYYLAGYAVECALKACIAKDTERHDFPDKKRANDSFSHNLRDLARIAGLDAKLPEDAEADPRFADRWKVVCEWSEQSRYHIYAKQEADVMLDAVSNKTHGAIQWIKRYW
ncbi:MAG: HEPN domain-containing protein [Acidobacteriaceae bacterium]